MVFTEKRDEKELAGQVALVTGGGRGIGRAIAMVLALAGATVAIASRTEEQLLETVALIQNAGGEAQAFVADMTDQRPVEKMVTEVRRQLGSIDILVNNAGRHHALGPLWLV